MNSELTKLFKGLSNPNIDCSEFFEASYNTFYKRVKGYNYGKNSTFAEDLTQNAFMKFYDALQKRAIMKFQEDEDILKYLITISKRLYLNSRKKKDNQSFEMIENLDSDSKRFAISSHDKFEQKERLNFLSKQIPSKQWEMFKLQSEGFSIEEIAKELKMTEGGIKKAMSRSRKRNNALFKQLKL